MNGREAGNNPADMPEIPRDAPARQPRRTGITRIPPEMIGVPVRRRADDERWLRMRELLPSSIEPLKLQLGLWHDEAVAVMRRYQKLGWVTCSPGDCPRTDEWTLVWEETPASDDG